MLLRSGWRIPCTRPDRAKRPRLELPARWIHESNDHQARLVFRAERSMTGTFVTTAQPRTDCSLRTCQVSGRTQLREAVGTQKKLREKTQLPPSGMRQLIEDQRVKCGFSFHGCGYGVQPAAVGEPDVQRRTPSRSRIRCCSSSGVVRSVTSVPLAGFAIFAP